MTARGAIQRPEASTGSTGDIDAKKMVATYGHITRPRPPPKCVLPSGRDPKFPFSVSITKNGRVTIADLSKAPGLGNH